MRLWRVAAGTGLLLSVYVGAWTLRRQVGLIRPCANLRYFYYADHAAVDEAGYAIFWPLMKLDQVLQRRRYGCLVELHFRDREPFVLATEP